MAKPAMPTSVPNATGVTLIQTSRQENDPDRHSLTTATVKAVAIRTKPVTTYEVTTDLTSRGSGFFAHLTIKAFTVIVASCMRCPS